MRRDFSPNPADTAYLESLGLRWETLASGGEYWLVIYGWPLPPGYRRETTDVAVKIEPGYPAAQLDMAYFYPPLARLDGLPINATQAVQPLDGKSWQRWSRHRTGANPWVPGEDCLETHMVLVTDWLAREFQPRAA